MSKRELYIKYLRLGLDRKVSEGVFYSYLRKYGGYNEVIAYLSQPKKTQNNKKGKTKADGLLKKEIVDYSRLFSIEKAAREYNLSERTVNRYIKEIESGKK